MKEVIIIIVILLIIFLGNIAIQMYLGKSIDEIEPELNKLKIEAVYKKNFTEAKNILDNILENWDNKKEKWSVIADHNHIDKIELSLISIKSKIELEEEMELLSEIDKSIFLLKDTKEKNVLKLKNIF